MASHLHTRKACSPLVTAYTHALFFLHWVRLTPTNFLCLGYHTYAFLFFGCHFVDFSTAGCIYQLHSPGSSPVNTIYHSSFGLGWLIRLYFRVPADLGGGHFLGQILVLAYTICEYGQIFNILHNSQWNTSLTQSGLVLYSFGSSLQHLLMW